MREPTYNVVVKVGRYNDFDCVVGWDISYEQWSEMEVRIERRDPTDDEGLIVEMNWCDWPRVYSNPANYELNTVTNENEMPY